MRRDKYSGNANELYSFSRKQVVTPAASNDQIHAYIYNNHHYNWKWTNTLNWAHTFAKVHDVGALVGFEEGLNYGTYIDTNKYGVIDPTITDMSTVTNMDYIKGDDHESRFRSWFGRVNYAFDSKYLLEVDFRYDGSSRFAPKNRWGFFPSASAGWRISEENFAKNSFLNVFDNLKLRASYGKLGNSAVDDYAYQSWYETGFAIMGGKKVPRFYLRNLPNIDITWETTNTLNLGVDFSLLNNRLSGVLDYYNKRTTGILYSPSIALTYGDKVSPLQNLAEVRVYDSEDRYILTAKQVKGLSYFATKEEVSEAMREQRRLAGVVKAYKKDKDLKGTDALDLVLGTASDAMDSDGELNPEIIKILRNPDKDNIESMPAAVGALELDWSKANEKIRVMERK